MNHQYDWFDNDNVILFAGVQLLSKELQSQPVALPILKQIMALQILNWKINISTNVIRDQIFGFLLEIGLGTYGQSKIVKLRAVRI